MTKKEFRTIIRSLIKDREVATIYPSSKSLIKKIFKCINFTKDILVIEYGAGTGSITKAFIKKLSRNSRLIAIEKNPNLFNFIRNIEDDRLISINNDVRDIHKIHPLIKKEKADYIISGIPFSMLKPKERISIIKEAKELLSTNGKLILYQFSPLMKKYLAKDFRKVRIRFEPINIPPMFILEAHK